MAAEVTPARVGLLIDYLDKDGGFDDTILPSLQLVADDYVSGASSSAPSNSSCEPCKAYPTVRSARFVTRSTNSSRKTPW